MKKHWLSAVACLFGLFAILPAAENQPVKTFQGTLRTGIVAIGGETTGVVLETEKEGRYELEFGKDIELAKRAEKLNAKVVVVTGEYRPRDGAEVKVRRIILVASLAEAKPPGH